MVPGSLESWSLALLAQAGGTPPGDRNSLYAFCSWSLVTFIAVSLVWPVNVVVMAAAYKVRHGARPIPLDWGAFLVRSAAACLGLTIISLAAVALAYLLIEEAELPAGMIYLVLLLLYIAAAVGFLFWIYALEDILQALGVLMLFVLMAGLPLLVIGRIAGWWPRLAEAAPWLLYP